MSTKANVVAMPASDQELVKGLGLTSATTLVMGSMIGSGVFIVEGIQTSIPLHLKILADPDFRAGNFDTRFMERFMPAKKR